MSTRRLILMRHAKSDWSGGQSDHQRPLNKRGRRAAPQMGTMLVERGWTPEVVISSDSERTTETWLLMADALPGLEPRFTSRLYLPSLQAILDEVAELPDARHTAMLLGHNPGFSQAVTWLSEEEVELKTAHVALLEQDAAHWSETTDRGAWRLVDVLKPKKK